MQVHVCPRNLIEINRLVFSLHEVIGIGKQLADVYGGTSRYGGTSK